MAISNVETAASRADYDVHTNRSNSKDRNSKPHNAQAKPEQPSGGNPPKEDTVTISDEGMKRFSFRKLNFPIEWSREGLPQKGTPEYEEYIRNREEEMEKNLIEYKVGGGVIKAREGLIVENQAMDEETASAYRDWGYKVGAEESIFNSLNGKAGNASKEVASQLASLIFSSSDIGTHDTDLETRAANREAARDLAKRIAETYMSDPKEAQAFIDEINKHIEKSELLDKGYFDWGDRLAPPEPPSDDERWNKANWDKYFGHLGISYEDGKGEKILTSLFVKAFQDPGSVSAEEREAMDAYRAMRHDMITESMAYARKVNTPHKFWPDGSEGPSWEETKEMNCDPRFSMYSEENKAWYKDFLAKSNLVQNIIDNAKLITDFSGNEKWNIVMNLLTPKQGEK